jgi:hypothetical protein
MNMGCGVDRLLNEEILESGYHPCLKDKDCDPKGDTQHGNDGLPFSAGEVRKNDL